MIKLNQVIFDDARNSLNQLGKFLQAIDSIMNSFNGSPKENYDAFVKLLKYNNNNTGDGTMVIYEGTVLLCVPIEGEDIKENIFDTNLVITIKMHNNNIIIDVINYWERDKSRVISFSLSFNEYKADLIALSEVDQTLNRELNRYEKQYEIEEDQNDLVKSVNIINLFNSFFTTTWWNYVILDSFNTIYLHDLINTNIQ